MTCESSCARCSERPSSSWRKSAWRSFAVLSSCSRSSICCRSFSRRSRPRSRRRMRCSGVSDRRLPGRELDRDAMLARDSAAPAAEPERMSSSALGGPRWRALAACAAAMTPGRPGGALQRPLALAAAAAAPPAYTICANVAAKSLPASLLPSRAELAPCSCAASCIVCVSTVDVMAGTRV